MTPEQLAKNGSEDAHQMALFAWAALEKKKWPQLEWLHAIPNGGDRSARAGAKMKATGARKGVWDIHLPVPLMINHDNGAVTFCPGLYIEMKKAGTGRLSDEQKVFDLHLAFYGYKAVICYTWEEAKYEIEKYLYNVPADSVAGYQWYMRSKGKR